MTYHFSLFLYFTPLYIFVIYISVIYNVFLNKALEVFDEKSNQNRFFEVLKNQNQQFPLEPRNPQDWY
jgi:hypothetical protein